MNANFEMAYLSGGDEVFGPNFGGATVYTNVRQGYVSECPNVGKFISNLKFTLKMENEIMGAILNDGKDAKVAAKEWLKANPDAMAPWLEGVTTFDGGDAKAAVTRRLAASSLNLDAGARASRASAAIAYRDGQVTELHDAAANFPIGQWGKQFFEFPHDLFRVVLRRRSRGE